MSNDQEIPEIDIAYIQTEEVLAWKRPIALRFKGNDAKITLYWNLKDGYSAIIERFFDGWTLEEQTEFILWTQEQENLDLLNEETGGSPGAEEADQVGFPTDVEDLKPQKLQVLLLNWHGKPKAQIQLRTSDAFWASAAVISLGDYSLATIGQMMSLVKLGYESAIVMNEPTQIDYAELVESVRSHGDSELDEFLAWLVSFEHLN
jgi:hypothetical protein